MERIRIIVGERKLVKETDKSYKVYIPRSVAKELLKRGIERVTVELLVDEEGR